MADLYAVFGHPIGHSLSPQIHAAFAKACGQNIVYEAIEAPCGGLAVALRAFRQRGGLGANITAPFKPDAFALADALSPHARVAGAVNALTFEASRIVGENFDGIGLVRDIEHNLGRSLAHKRIALLGAGGAARGVAPAILGRNPQSLTLVNRDFAKAASLAAHLGAVEACRYEDLPQSPPFDIIINATSASWGGAMLPIPPTCFAAGGLAYDLAYGRGLTAFLAQAQAGHNVYLADGLGMLVEQAAEAFAWWRGIRPQTAPVIAQLTVPLLTKAVL